MARMHLPTVIYNIIGVQMETVHNINIIPKSSNIRPGVRLALTVVGIVAAIICLLTFLSEVRSPAGIATISHVIEVSKNAPGDFFVGATSVKLLSAIWPF
jgi:hypothetical protein